MKPVLIKIEYPGSVISVNHYKHAGGMYTKKEAIEWATHLGWEMKMYHFEDWKLPLEVKCSGYFVNERSAPDISNLAKLILDELEEVTQINDRNFRWRDGVRDVGHTKEPYLIICVREVEEC